MHSGRFWVVVLLVASLGCAHGTGPFEKSEDLYAPIEASLCHINQKVASHFFTGDIPNDFDAAQFKEVVKIVCYSNPVCMSQAQEIFDLYGVGARKVDDMFSIMLCDKEKKWKVMEDFSCNNLRVEIQSWKNGNKVPCEFENNWERIQKENCNE